MSSENDSAKMSANWPDRLRFLSDRLNSLRTLQESRPRSQVPLLGPLLVTIRQLGSRLFTRWYVQPIMEQQNRFNEQVTRTLDDMAAMIVQLRKTPVAMQLPREPGLLTAPKGFGFDDLVDVEQLEEIDAAALLTWENSGVPTEKQHEEALEAAADEKLDEETILNYPLTWRSWAEGWRYLYDLAVANEILGCHPGDLVLDCAAGACWATESLHRLGIRTVSLDLSHETLRRGRMRLAADQRLRQRERASFSVGSAMRLPFADESFDGVLCMNALHHMPSYRRVLQEIHRVLKQGGRAVFSEPGTRHAYGLTSQLRMRELGVLEKNVSLPLLYRLSREVGFARMQVVPLRSPSFYLFDYTATPADLEAFRQLWEDTLLYGPQECARFVLQKGAERPPDSLMAPQDLLHHYRLEAHLELASACGQVHQGEEISEELVVSNTGDVIWRAQGLAGQVCLGLKVYTQHGSMIRDDIRTPLPADVAPGEQVSLSIRVPTFSEPGCYRLKYDLVAEHVTWFEQVGSPVVERTLHVIA